MSWMLRHCQEPRYIDLNGGWAGVNIILAALKKKYPNVTLNTIEQIVAEVAPDCRPAGGGSHPPSRSAAF